MLSCGDVVAFQHIEEWQKGCCDLALLHTRIAACSEVERQWIHVPLPCVPETGQLTTTSHIIGVPVTRTQCVQTKRVEWSKRHNRFLP